MKTVLFFLTTVLLWEEIYTEIYYLNETEHSRMPAIYSLDDFNQCFKEPEGLYCVVNFDLVSDKPNDLLHMIQEYSKVTIKHFNHTKLRYGICVNKKCQRYTQNTTVVSVELLEGCLNQSLWENFGLKTRVSHHTCDTSPDKNFDINIGDIVVAVLLLTILVINVVGSIYDICCVSDTNKAKELLVCFSISRNWKRLIWINDTSDERLHRLKGLNGIRCVFLVFILLAHCSWPALLNAENTHDLEMIFNNPLDYMSLTGSLSIQSFLVISGFLLVYKVQIYSEKHEINWMLVPKGILLRYLRLTPALAIIIAFMATWLRFLGLGPQWELSGALEVEACRNRWWASLLYINNYFNNSICLMQTWYLAADVQLFYLGLILCVLLKKPGHRKLVLFCLLVLGLIIPAVHIYFQDLDAILTIRPEAAKALFANDPTFNEVYKGGHTNLASYIVGLSLGYLVHKWRQDEIDINKCKKYRIFYWLTFPLCLLIFVSASIFYRDGPRDPAYIRALYGVLSRLMFSLFFALIILGMVFKIEGFYRTLMEWNGWRVPARLSYCVYLLHFPLLTIYTSVQTELKIYTLYNKMAIFGGIIISSFATAIILWLMVEAPFTELTKYFMSEPKTEKNISKDESELK